MVDGINTAVERDGLTNTWRSIKAISKQASTSPDEPL